MFRLRALIALTMLVALSDYNPLFAFQDGAEAAVAAVTETAADAAPAEEAAPGEDMQANMNALWTVLAAFLVFFMQAGFALVETGFTRAKNACNIIMKNLMDFSIGSLSFWLVGFGLMFGATSTGWFGTNGFFFDATNADAQAVGNTESFGWAFLIFQTVFCATAATIVSGAMAERTKFSAYLLYSVGITVIVYPIFGSWAWGSLWAGSGWLEGMDFYDFAGSTVVHSIGGWCALAGAIVIGPRLGKYKKDGKVMPIPGHNIPLAALGVFILWLGWFGFNAGSTTSITGSGASFTYIAVTTNLAAAAGSIGALIASWIKFKKPDTSFALNGALAGLVSITAGCDALTPAYAALAGFLGGILVVFSVLFFDKIKIDDPVGAISVHGVCGVWGTLAVGLFSANPLLPQIIGVGAAFAWAFPVSFVIFYVIKVTVGLRVTEEEEMAGLDITEHGMLAYPPGFVADHTSGSPLAPIMASASMAGYVPSGVPATSGGPQNS